MSLSVCPDPETLALLVEHPSAVSGRAALLRHVAECADCYVAFVETAHFTQSSAGAALPPSADLWRPLPSPRSAWPSARPSHAWRGLAAAAVVAVALGVTATRVHAPDAATRVEPPAPAGAAPAAGAPSTLAPAVTATDPVPAWVVDARWRALAGSREDFAAARPDRQALVLGMEMATLEAICQRLGPTERWFALREVTSRWRDGRLVPSTEAEDLETRAAGGECAPRASRAGLDSWVDLGRSLESWRIAAAAHDADALAPARSRAVAEALRALPIEDARRRSALALAGKPRAGTASWESLEADIQELIDLLCA